MVLKDISNMQTGLRSKTDRNDLDALVTKLRAIDGMFLQILSNIIKIIVLILVGSTVEVFTADDETFTGILFQDPIMKSTFVIPIQKFSWLMPHTNLMSYKDALHISRLLWTVMGKAKLLVPFSQS